jgi:hypothetical protein
MSIMETMQRKQPRARRLFTAEFKAEWDAGRLVMAG